MTSAGIWLVSVMGLLGLLTPGSFCDDIPIDTSHYHNYTTLHNLFQRLSKENPSLAKLYSIGQSVQGRELYVLRISSDLDQIKEKSDSKDDLSFALNSKPMFKYVANMHGNFDNFFYFTKEHFNFTQERNIVFDQALLN